MTRTLRRLVLTALLAVSLIPVPSPSSAQVPAYAGYYENATAHWHPRIGKTLWWYFMDAYYVVDAPSGTLGKAFILAARGKCARHSGGIMCSATGRMHEVPREQFQMDPMMERAHAELRAGRYRHVVDWVAEGESQPPTPYAGVQGGSGGAGVYLAQWAPASGTLFGRRLRPAPGAVFPPTIGFLVQDAGAGFGIAAVLERHGIELREDGSFSVTKTVRSRGA